MNDKPPNNDEVLCPQCLYEFRAIPVNVQARIAELEAALAAVIARAEAMRDVLADAKRALSPPSVLFEAGYPMPAHLRMTAERAALLGRISAAIDAARAKEKA